MTWADAFFLLSTSALTSVAVSTVGDLFTGKLSFTGPSADGPRLELAAVVLGIWFGVLLSMPG